MKPSGVAGVVLTVDVGSVDDPPGRHGMAHTLEHLAFRAPDGDRPIDARTAGEARRRFLQRRDRALQRTTYGPSVSSMPSTSCWPSSSAAWPIR